MPPHKIKTHCGLMWSRGGTCATSLYPVAQGQRVTQNQRKEVVYMAKRSVRIEDGLSEDIKQLAQEQNTSENDIFNRALRFYRDYCYMQDKASVINQDVLNVARSMANVAEKNINYKTNKYLSELAVQQAMLNMIIGNSLDFSEQDLQVFRLKALDTIKETPRVLRLDEVHDG